MPRQKEYDRQAVIENAGAVFYEKGFEATSMSDLVSATGLNTASMYKEFKSKEGLFEATLDNYRLQHIQELIKGMSGNPCLDTLVAYFEKLRDYAQSDSFNGCLLMNNLAEIKIVSQGTADRIDSICERLDTLFNACLSKAQSDGEIPPGKDIPQLADFLLCIVHGITFYARMENRQPRLAGILDHAIASLKA